MSEDSSNEEQTMEEQTNIDLNEEAAMIQEVPEEDANEGAADQDVEDGKFAIETKQKQGDRTCATYCFKNEDHTLGNLLRFILIKNPDTEFCGYSISHPSESDMNLRLQTTGKGTNRVMKKGFKALKKVVEITENKFAAALETFKSKYTPAPSPRNRGTQPAKNGVITPASPIAEVIKLSK